MSWVGGWGDGGWVAMWWVGGSSFPRCSRWYNCEAIKLIHPNSFAPIWSGHCFPHFHISILFRIPVVQLVRNDPRRLSDICMQAWIDCTGLHRVHADVQRTSTVQAPYTQMCLGKFLYNSTQLAVCLTFETTSRLYTFFYFISIIHPPIHFLSSLSPSLSLSLHLSLSLSPLLFSSLEWITITYLYNFRIWFWAISMLLKLFIRNPILILSLSLSLSLLFLSFILTYSFLGLRV